MANNNLEKHADPVPVHGNQQNYDTPKTPKTLETHQGNLFRTALTTFSEINYLKIEWGGIFRKCQRVKTPTKLLLVRQTSKLLKKTLHASDPGVFQPPGY